MALTHHGRGHGATRPRSGVRGGPGDDGRSSGPGALHHAGEVAEVPQIGFGEGDLAGGDDMDRWFIQGRNIVESAERAASAGADRWDKWSRTTREAPFCETNFHTERIKEIET